MFSTSETREYRASVQDREGLTAMILELLANGVILDELVDCYRMFRFTGGAVPRARWRLAALADYPAHPFAADRVSTSKAQRYCDLADEIMALGQTLATGRPRTLRARWDITDKFSATSAEIRVLGCALEAGLTALLNEPEDLSLFAARKHAFDKPEQPFSATLYGDPS